MLRGGVFSVGDASEACKLDHILHEVLQLSEAQRRSLCEPSDSGASRSCTESQVLFRMGVNTEAREAGLESPVMQS